MIFRQIQPFKKGRLPHILPDHRRHSRRLPGQVRIGFSKGAHGVVGNKTPLPFRRRSSTVDSLRRRSARLDLRPVPPVAAKPRRFVVRVAGDSMSPTLNIGDLVVFEYHRPAPPRRPNRHRQPPRIRPRHRRYRSDQTNHHGRPTATGFRPLEAGF